MTYNYGAISYIKYMKVKTALKNALSLIAATLLSAASVLFATLYFKELNGGFFAEHKKLFVALFTALALVTAAMAIVFSANDNKFIFKLSVIILSLFALAFSVLYILKTSGVMDKIDSVEDLRNYVSSFGYMAAVIYILVNFLQVVVLPIPGVVSVGAGVALFGEFKTFIFAFIGITLGSIAAFFIGKIFGYKAAKWLVGEETLKKWLGSVKGKDKIALTFMFLFPFFPDDVLCFVAGISSMSTGYFLIMITVTRLISTVLTAYSLSGSLIPFNTWWGLVLWAVIVAVTVALTVVIYKYGDKMEKYFKTKFLKKGGRDLTTRGK